MRNNPTALNFPQGKDQYRRTFKSCTKNACNLNHLLIPVNFSSIYLSNYSLLNVVHRHIIMLGLHRNVGDYQIVFKIKVD